MSESEDKLRQESGPPIIRDWGYECLDCGAGWINPAGYPGRCQKCGKGTYRTVNKNIPVTRKIICNQCAYLDSILCGAPHDADTEACDSFQPMIC